MPRCSPRAREFSILVNFYVRRTVAELRGFKVAQFSDGLFSPYKTRKTYRPVTNLEARAQGLHRRMIPIFLCGNRCRVLSLSDRRYSLSPLSQTQID